MKTFTKISKFAAFAAIAAIGFSLGACKEKEQENAFTDARDKKTYRTVKIGEQVWMAENLNYAAKDSRCYGEGGKVIINYDGSFENPNYGTLTNDEIQAICAKYGRFAANCWDSARR